MTALGRAARGDASQLAFRPLDVGFGVAARKRDLVRTRVANRDEIPSAEIALDVRSAQLNARVMSFGIEITSIPGDLAAHPGVGAVAAAQAVLVRLLPREAYVDGNDVIERLLRVGDDVDAAKIIGCRERALDFEQYRSGVGVARFEALDIF